MTVAYRLLSRSNSFRVSSELKWHQEDRTVDRKTNFRVIAVLNIGLLLCLPILDNPMTRERTKFSSQASAAEGRRIRLEEATIAAAAEPGWKQFVIEEH